ncbi:MAG: hypothetical protein IPK20_20530 [Betaproteobacteria bacterium]|nr:hypothetical protein [Betaproteobacteria bacterium]
MNIDVTGTLPVYFPTESMYRGDILIGGKLTASLDDGLEVKGTAGASGDQFIVVPPDILTFDFSQFSAMDNLGLIIDGVDGFLAVVQDFLDGDVAGLKMPLIGDKLSGAATFIQDFRESFIDGLRDVVQTSNDPTSNYISVQLFNLLHSTLGILEDRNEDGTVTVEDVGLTTNVDQAGVAAKDIFMQWNLRLGGQLVDVGTGIDFDLGLPGLGLETRGEVKVDIGWSVDFGFGIGGGQGFYLDLSDDDELALEVDVKLPGAGITGTLGFLQFEANDKGGTGLGASIVANLTTTSGEDERVGLLRMGDIRVNAGVAAEAKVDLAMQLRLNSEFVPNAATAFPKVVGDFFLDWSIGDRDKNEYVSLGGLGDAIGAGCTSSSSATWAWTWARSSRTTSRPSWPR